jgi:DNA-binding phage protein
VYSLEIRCVPTRFPNFAKGLAGVSCQAAHSGPQLRRDLQFLCTASHCRSISDYLKAKSFAALRRRGSRGVSINSRRSLSRRMKANPKRGSASICQLSAAKRRIAAVIVLIDDGAQPEKIEGVYVRFDDLDQIAADVRKFKDSLRTLVDERGGIGKLAALTAIPQPSLSRFFNTSAMPRRTTLQKIARALGLSQIQIATEWSV